MDKLIPTKPTEKELEEGSSQRAQFRNKVLADKSQLDSGKSSFELLKVSVSDLDKLINSELDWLQKNIEVVKQQINLRRTAYTEKLDLYIKSIGEKSIELIVKFDPKDQQTIIKSFPFTQYKKRLTDATLSVNQKEQEKRKEEAEKSMNRSTTEVAVDGALTALKYAAIAFFLILSLRAAGFNANDTLWRPMSYRILNFIYTFLFGFIWVPYYIVWEVRAIIDSFIGTPYEKAVKAPIWYSLFPMTPFTPKQPVLDPKTGEKIQPPEEFNLNRLFFGYPDTEVVREWIKCKCNEWEQQQSCALKSNLFEELKKENSLKID
jgi:hypothetical protein